MSRISTGGATVHLTSGTTIERSPLTDWLDIGGDLVPAVKHDAIVTVTTTDGNRTDKRIRFHDREQSEIMADVLAMLDADDAADLDAIS